MNLAGYQNSPVSGIRHETAQTLFEGRLTREAIAARERMSSEANKTSPWDVFTDIADIVL